MSDAPTREWTPPIQPQPWHELVQPRAVDPWPARILTFAFGTILVLGAIKLFWG